MTTNTYSLGTMVSFLESMLGAVGHAQPTAETTTRGALKKRLRELTRLYELERQASAHVPRGRFMADTGTGVSFDSLSFRSSYATSTRIVKLPSGIYDVDEVLADWVGPPFLDDVRTTSLDVALRIDRDGAASVFESVMAYWARRHEVTTKTPSPDKRPRRRRALDRLLLALMRFVFGFFGGHKVDARNNP